MKPVFFSLALNILKVMSVICTMSSALGCMQCVCVCVSIWNDVSGSVFASDQADICVTWMCSAGSLTFSCCQCPSETSHHDLHLVITKPTRWEMPSECWWHIIKPPSRLRWFDEGMKGLMSQWVWRCTGETWGHPKSFICATISLICVLVLHT